MVASEPSPSGRRRSPCPDSARPSSSCSWWSCCAPASPSRPSAGSLLYVRAHAAQQHARRQSAPHQVATAVATAPSAHGRARHHRRRRRPSAPQGGVLRLPGAMPPTFDPALSGDSTSAGYIVEIFSGLVTADPDLELDPGHRRALRGQRRRPHLHLPPAARTWSSTTARSCHRRRLPLLPGALLQPRAPARPPPSPTWATSSAPREMLSGPGRHLEGVKVIDDYTLEITIDAPKPAFLAKLSHPVAFVVDRDSHRLRRPGGPPPTAPAPSA